MGLWGVGAAIAGAAGAAGQGVVGAIKSGQTRKGTGSGSIGFNPTQVGKMTNELTTQWRNLQLYMKKEFNDVQKVMRDEWIGPDQEDFEIKCLNRLNDLYDCCEETVEGVVTQMLYFSKTWIEFQEKNNADVSRIGNHSQASTKAFNFKENAIKSISKVNNWLSGGWFNDAKNGIQALFKTVSKNVKKLGDGIRDTLEKMFVYHQPNYEQENAFRGLKHGAQSAAKIHSAVQSFVDKIKSQTEKLFQTVNANSAFFGDQTASLNKYIEMTSQAVTTLATALKDLDRALDVHAKANYVNYDSTTMVDAVRQAQQSLQNSVNNTVGNAKWS